MIKNDVYKCNICGNIVELNHIGNGKLVCCGENMEKKIEQIANQTIEKHIPIIEKTDNGIKIKVGSIEHPMENSHYIERIEIITKTNNVYKHFLKPGDKPEVEFPIHDTDIIVREYCNLHGLWKS